MAQEEETRRSYRSHSKEEDGAEWAVWEVEEAPDGRQQQDWEEEDECSHEALVFYGTAEQSIWKDTYSKQAK